MQIKFSAKSKKGLPINQHEPTEFILDPDNKISTGVENLFHCSARISIQRTLSKQFTYSTTTPIFHRLSCYVYIIIIIIIIFKKYFFNI